jgi:hypothetical protein
VARVVTGQEEQARSTVVEDAEPPRSVALESTGFGRYVRSRPSCDGHHTGTIDVVVAVSGGVALVVESETHMRSGYCVQRGARWLWEKPALERCVSTGGTVVAAG